MKSEQELRFDYQNAMNQAQKLETAASELDSRVVRRMSSSEEALHAVWKGENALRFLTKESALRTNISGSARELRSLAEEIRIAAKRIYDAETRALQIARERQA